MDDLFVKGKIGRDERDRQKGKFRALHRTLMRTMKAESESLKRLKKLMSEYEESVEKRNNAEARRAEDLLELTDIKRENAKADNRLSIATENLSVLRTTQVELERKKAILESAVDEIREKKAAEEKPVIERLERDVKELRVELVRNNDLYEKKAEFHRK